MLAFLHQNSFPCTVLLVATLHVSVGYWFSGDTVELPTSQPSRVGGASMSVRASRGSRPKIVGEGGPGAQASKVEEMLAKAQLELPPLPAPIESKLTPRPAERLIEPVARPIRTELLDLKGDTRAADTVDLSELPLPVAAANTQARRPVPPLARPTPPASKAAPRPLSTAAPKLKAENLAKTGPDLSDLPALSTLPLNPASSGTDMRKPSKSTGKATTAKTAGDVIPSGGLQRPGAGGAPDIPELKAVTEVTDTGSFPSRGSVGSDGVEGVELPGATTNAPLRYPPEALARGQEGSGKVLIRIDADGRVTSVSLHVSSGFELLDRAALEDLRRWVYNPARRNGRAIPFEFVQPFVFYIRR